MLMRVRIGPVWREWEALHRDYVPGRRFADEQVRGPFAAWLHTHSFEPIDAQRCRLSDRVDYALPAGALGSLAAGRYVDARLRRLFAFRQRRTQDDLSRHLAYADRAPLRVAISGASGLIGTELAAFLESGGHSVIRLVRRPAGPGDVSWDPDAGVPPDAAALEGLDAVVNLAGVSLASSRWSPQHKRLLYDSRIRSTDLLAHTIASLERPPKALLNASAVGYYGDRGDTELDETSPSGDGFLPELCRAWEAATQPAADVGVRVLMLRSGVVLSGRGGVLPAMLPAFRAGVGGPIGGGAQWVSWISLDDWLGAALLLLHDESIAGPVAMVAPQPVTNKQLGATLGRVLRRPARLPLPAAAVRAAFGEMGERLLLDSTRVRPTVLTRAGFRFLYPDLAGAARMELGHGGSTTAGGMTAPGDAES